MSKYVHILDLNNSFEAGMLEEILKDNGVPFAIIPTEDTAFGSIEKMELGFGYLSAPEEYRDQIISLYQQIR